MNTPEMSDCDLLHTLRWSSRLQIPSYVAWIKVQPQLCVVTVTVSVAVTLPACSACGICLGGTCACLFYTGSFQSTVQVWWIWVLAFVGSPYQAGHEGWTCCSSHWTDLQQVHLSEVWCGNSRGILCSTGELWECSWMFKLLFLWGDLHLLFHLLYFQISSFCAVDCTTILQLHEVPSLQSIYTLDAAISKIQVSLDEHFSKLAAETDPQKSSEITKNLLPATLQLIDTYATFTRYSPWDFQQEYNFLLCFGLSLHFLCCFLRSAWEFYGPE